jgi:hypothetical protein
MEEDDQVDRVGGGGIGAGYLWGEVVDDHGDQDDQLFFYCKYGDVLL